MTSPAAPTPAGTPADTPPPAPETTSLNEPTYEAAPIGTQNLIPSAVADVIEEEAPPPRVQRTAAREATGYRLLAPPSYDTIVGGEAPSPFVSAVLLLGIAGLLGAAVAEAAGYGAPEWWLYGGLFLVVAIILAGFISRSA